MKKRLFPIAIIATLFISAIIMVACNKEEESSNQDNSSSKVISNILSYDQINAVAKDIVVIHNYELRKGLNDPYLSSHLRPDNYVYMTSLIPGDISTLGLNEMSQYTGDLNLNVLEPILRLMGNRADQGLPDLFPSGVNGNLIQECLDSCIERVNANFWKAETYDEFVNLCDSDFAQNLERLSLEEYFYGRISAEVALGSFCTWIDIMYGNSSSKSVLKEMKKFIKWAMDNPEEFWEALKPYIAADADGFLRGAGSVSTLGAIVGTPVGAGAMVTVGAAVSAYESS